MQIKSQNVESIICVNCAKISKSFDVYCYKVNEKNGSMQTIFTKKDKYDSAPYSEQIVSDSGEFVNGFKVVKMYDDKYAFLREEDNKIMPYRYDVATTFNNYGFAMVGKDGTVSWINKDFQYLNYKGKMVEENNNPLIGFDGWDGVYNFSECDSPLSRIFCGKEHFGRTSYFNTNGEIKKFYQFDGDTNKEVFRKEFYSGTNFDISKRAIADNYILLSDGFCILMDDLLKSSVQSGFVDYLFNNAKYNFNKNEDAKTLKK